MQVASLDNIATDATVHGGTADQATTPQTSLGAAPDGTPTADEPSTRSENPSAAGSGKPTPGQKLKHVYEVPDDAVSYTTSDGTQFYAPPYANFQKVYAAANWQNPIAAFFAIWVNGTYDFQRDNE
jgi:hypothetical protein